VRNSVHRNPLALFGLGVVCALSVAASVARAESQPTQINDTMTFGGPVCTIDIVGGDVTVCAGSDATYTADVTCAAGYERSDFDPTWLLDGSPVGSGESIQLSLALGTYTLTAHCGSCTDEITVMAIDCTNQPFLDARFSDDATEGTTGIFMHPNITAVSPVTFPQVKFNMRPFTLDADPGMTEGAFVLETSGAPVLQFFTPAGTAVALPHTYDVSELPVELYCNATAFGQATVTARFDAVGGPTDDVVVRVGPFPGISGEPLAEYPSFNFVDSFNSNGVMHGALDGARHAERDGLSYRAYVVAHKTPAQWAANNALVDVSGGFENAVFSTASIAANTTLLWGVGLNPGTLVSQSYDIVYDFGLDGTLDPGDIIDKLSLVGEAGAYVVKDLTAAGPYTVLNATYTGGSFLGQKVYYPSNIASLGQVPLIIMSHGNGHDYRWYDYLGTHYASHGYVFMAHENNTQPGVMAASTTTLTNTDYFLGNLGTIAGGVLNGHIDDHKIIWSGHSRGGEGVVIAYDRIFDGTYVPVEYVISDLIVVSSVAPTVFLGATTSDPHGVNYHLIGAAGDGDVSGAPNCNVCQYFRLADRATGTVQVMYVHGTDHNDYNCCGFNDYDGPAGAEIGRPEAQKIARSYYLALVEWYAKGNPATKEYLTRMYDDIHPSGILGTAEVALSYTERNTPANFIIDDYQSQPGTGTSSSGGSVTFDVTNLTEDNLNDNNTSFTWIASDPMNGMTFYSDGGDFAKGVVYDYTVGDTRFVEFEVPVGQRDVRGKDFVSFRACQGTRHPETVALNTSHSFSVTLRDGDGVSSTMHFGAWGKLTPLFQRTGAGTGAGWVNEMNTVRARLSSFETNGSSIDLSNIVAVRLEYGAAFGSNRGRIGLDDVQFTSK